MTILLIILGAFIGYNMGVSFAMRNIQEILNKLSTEQAEDIMKEIKK